MARRKTPLKKQPATRRKKRQLEDTSLTAESPMQEIEVRKRYALKCVTAGMRTWLITEAMCNEFPGLTIKQAEYSFNLMMGELRDNYVRDIKAAAPMQVNRILNHIVELTINAPVMGPKGQMITRKKDHSALARYEMLLARILGTLKPVRVELDADHSIQDALGAALGNETSETFEKRIERQVAQRKALANAGVELDSAGNVVH